MLSYRCLVWYSWEVSVGCVLAENCLLCLSCIIVACGFSTLTCSLIEECCNDIAVWTVKTVWFYFAACSDVQHISVFVKCWRWHLEQHGTSKLTRSSFWLMLSIATITFGSGFNVLNLTMWNNNTIKREGGGESLMWTEKLVCGHLSVAHVI